MYIYLLSKRITAYIQVLISHNLVKLGLHLDLPIIIAFGWRAGMRYSNKIKSKKFGKKKLVILPKSAGVDDIVSAYLENKAEYPVLFLPRNMLVLSANHYKIQERVTNMNYHSNDKELELDKEKYKKHLIRVLKWFNKIFGVSAFVQFNIIYSAERALALACKECEITFVATHKECNWSTANIDLLIDFYKKSVAIFPGHAISVYNTVYKNIFVKAGILKKKNIHVVGCSRLDQSHVARLQNIIPQNKSVLFYLIEPIAGPLMFQYKNNYYFKGIPISDGTVVTWSQMIKNVYKTIMNLANKHPDINFICKGKMGHGNQQVQDLINASDINVFPQNVKLIKAGVGHKLLDKASVVIGFNTTAVLEAIAAGVPTIVPNIFSEQEKLIADHSHDVNDGVLVAKTNKELETMILKTVKNGFRYQKLNLGHKKTLDKIMGNSDGKSGKRLRNFLDQAVAGSFLK